MNGLRGGQTDLLAGSSRQLLVETGRTLRRLESVHSDSFCPSPPRPSYLTHLLLLLLLLSLCFPLSVIFTVSG